MYTHFFILKIFFGSKSKKVVPKYQKKNIQAQKKYRKARPH